MSPFVAAERGYIDEVIMPHSTRPRVARALRLLRGKELANPWKKHDNIPFVNLATALICASDALSSDACVPPSTSTTTCCRRPRNWRRPRKNRRSGPFRICPKGSNNAHEEPGPGPGGTTVENGWYVLPGRGVVVTNEMIDRLTEEADLEDAGLRKTSSMRALLDVSILLALFDRDHHHHATAMAWWTANQRDGWASCPLTENGFVRIVSQPAYPRCRALLMRWLTCVLK